MRLLRTLIALLIFSLGLGGMTSCQYKFGYGEMSSRYPTLSIPYVDGDRDGDLTAELITKATRSGAFRYVSCGGEYILNVKLLELRDENIGFRYDRKKRGDLRKTIIPTETRLIAIAEAALIEAGTNQVIQGPVRITASVDFDHTDYRNWKAVNSFSLGQLNDIDAAYDAAVHPLNRQLAEKIIDYVMVSW